MSAQSFILKNLAVLLDFGHASEEPAQGHGRGSPRTNPPQPPQGGVSRIAQWASAAGRCLEAGDFAQGLDGGQVEGELSSIFRETPEFGRSLAVRLAESLRRFALAEAHFPTGLDLRALGTDGSFLLLQQPFLVGENPSSAQLTDWMLQRGWQPFLPPTRLDMLATLTWRRGNIIATDVRPENAILAESDGQIYPFDLIVVRQE